MKTYFCCILVLAGISFWVSAQSEVDHISHGRKFRSELLLPYHGFVAPLANTYKGENVFGSPYLNEDWVFGTLYLKQDTIPKVLVRYHILLQRMELIFEEDTLAIMSPFEVKKLEFCGKTFIYDLAFEMVGGEAFLTAAYFEHLVGDKCRLLLRWHTTTNKNKYLNYYMGGGGDGRLVLKSVTRFYIQQAGQAARRLRPGKKALLHELADKAPEIKAFMRREGIRKLDAEALIKIIVYYNTII